MDTAQRLRSTPTRAHWRAIVHDEQRGEVGVHVCCP